tara:strand:- start:42 stop:515 length:474 start_codon:yes stop_codon:yes gene_type:complete
MFEANLNGFAISDEMFEWITNNLEKSKIILEFGSGTGTRELTKHWEVYSVEQNLQWVGVAPKSTYIHAPIKDGWYDKDIVFKNIPKHYDLLIIDGPGGSDLRPGIDVYIDQLKTNIPIILDDTHRIKDKNHAIQLAKTLNKDWEEIKGWEKNFIILK